MNFPALIGIGGGSGSGKTTLARELVESVDALVLSLDSYYRDLSHLTHEERALWNFDHPDALEWPLLAEHLTSLAAGESIARPEYDFSTHTRKPGGEILRPQQVVIVEGIFALHDAAPRSAYRLRIFVDAPEAVRLERRVIRDVIERGRTPESVEEQFDATVRPMHDKYVEPTRLSADLIADGQQPFASVIESITEALGLAVA